MKTPEKLAEEYKHRNRNIWAKEDYIAGYDAGYAEAQAEIDRLKADWAVARPHWQEEINQTIAERDQLKADLAECVAALESYAMTNETFPEYGDLARQTLSKLRGGK